jgi:hypothetical protein
MNPFIALALTAAAQDINYPKATDDTGVGPFTMTPALPNVTDFTYTLPTPPSSRWRGGTEAPGTFEVRVERRRKKAKAARKARRVNR